MGKSSLDALLRNQYILSPGEASTVRTSIQEIDVRLRSLDARISRLITELVETTTQRNALLDQRTKYLSPLSLLRSFPPEVLGEIFVHAALDNPQTRLRLSHVCRHWRNVVLRTPSLWSTLDFSDEDNTREPVPSSIEQTISRLSHAGSLPLNLKYEPAPSPLLADPQEGADEEEVGDPALVQTLFKVANKDRWKSLSITSKNSADLQHVFGGYYIWDRLESLSLSARHSWTASTKIHGGDVFRLPCLRKLSLHLDRQEIDNHTIDGRPFAIPWPQLTVLDLETNSSPKEYLDILRECVLLEQCTLAFDVPDPVLDNPLDPPISMATLQEFRLSSNEFPTHFLSSIKAPVLRRFTFEIAEEPGVVEEEVSWFLYDVGHTLELLDIHLYDVDHDVFLGCFNSMDSLQELRIRTTERASQVETLLKALTLSIDNSRLCLPKLERFYITLYLTRNTESLFLSLVESRWWPADKECMFVYDEDKPFERIKSASLQNLSSELTCRERMEYLREKCEGLEVHYTTLEDDGDMMY
ncbi:hypothetical protein NLJ89_g791 [Agrocybe chaxingu]|uniref:F-box domain-containing protein n=1 Tax=Agrocybe chaxingu TaxID=84603 RepID=A0A9W8TG53_9AGAR|nr:hypothetical protein NLJ89_g791 [Agrocybe chaxingu]